jgi:hypothetical protein
MEAQPVVLTKGDLQYLRSTATPSEGPDSRTTSPNPSDISHISSYTTSETPSNTCELLPTRKEKKEQRKKGDEHPISVRIQALVT